MNLFSYIKRNIYKWHRLSSILIAIPVIMWTLSGIMHPIMTSFKPKVKNQFLKTNTIDLSRIKITLDSALLKNNITSISNFRVIELKDKLYYQISQKSNNQLIFIDASTGQVNADAPVQYAQKLALQFLGDSTTRITSISLVKSFDDEYLEINRLLPVYKVNFDRKDGVRLYVDPVSDRLGLAMDDNRAAFTSFFRNFHSWEFLKSLGSFQTAVLVVLSGLAFITAVMGIYIAFISKSKKRSGTVRYRRVHRQIAIVVSVTTLMFTFSGAYHAFKKFEPDNRQNYFVEYEFKAKNLGLCFDSIATKYQVKNVSLVQMNNTSYVRLTCSSSVTNKGECCEKMNMAAAKFGEKGKADSEEIRYLSIPDLKELPNGEEQYARFMATTFSKNSDEKIVSATSINEFKGEYGFVNKRLPVYKVQFATNYNERWYVETSSGKMAAKINDMDLREGLSFSMLHKFHFADGIGKTTRDVLTVIAALGNLMAALAGIILLLIWYKRKKEKVSRVKA
ncbi:PepSY-associated TM helix domain-containing protein [Solitalea lacus]|uniref:PepSY-associated TM helix domain-containing protein n=1 Tax=Solitalea lacus TaxID=2911172 RepID=UPI001EDB4CEA|nr:PepSY-associated TM helix domain-containing protein [Solitalea lacus]UKJ08781.1 PepSY domain-containing protein [Solitalea lacus]